MYDDFLHGVDDLSFNKTKCNLQKIRSQQIPKLPLARSLSTEITDQFKNEFIIKHYSTTSRAVATDETPFFQIAVDEPEFSYCIFASDDIARLTRDSISDEK